MIALAGQPPVVKSGTDFRDATLITVGFEAAGGKPAVRDHERIVVDGAVPEDAEAKAVVARYQAMVDGEMDVPLGTSAVALDSRWGPRGPSRTPPPVETAPLRRMVLAGRKRKRGVKWCLRVGSVVRAALGPSYCGLSAV